jgi:hypothetical protein
MTENREEYFDCYISKEDLLRLREIPAFLIVPFYPKVEYAINGELGKIGIGHKRFLRFFLNKGMEI